MRHSATVVTLVLAAASPARAQTFTTTNYAVGAGPRGIALVDRGSNGIMDLAVANASAGTVTILDNNGSGAFTAAATVSITAPMPLAVASGRLDTTGTRNDLVVACADPVTPGVYQVAKVLQAGEGSQAVSYLTTQVRRPVHVACGDLDGDGLDEIVVAGEGEPLFGLGGMEVFWSGTSPTPVLSISFPLARVVLVNLDPQGGSDTDLDIALLVKGNPGRIDLIANDGVGHLTTQGSIDLGTAGFATSMCVGDIDGDGDADCVSLAPDPFGPTNGFLVHVNNGALALTAANVAAGKFALTGPFNVAGSFATDVTCGDFESDTVSGPLGLALAGQSRKDVCVINGGLGAPVLRSGFDGTTFAGTASPPTGTNPIAAVLEDFNGDGCDDIAITNQGSDDVTVDLTRPPALAQPFGVGCSGSNGTPAIGAVGLPTSGAAAFTTTLASARAIAPAILLFSVPAPPGFAIDFALTPSACRLYTPDPIVTLLLFTTVSGTATITFGIPAAIPLGIDAYQQWVVFDENGAYGPGSLAISNALRLQVGI